MKNNWKSCLFAMAALIAVATIHAQSSGTYTVHNLTVGGTATGSFGGGGSGTFQSLITDLKVSYTSGTRIDVAAGPCFDSAKSAMNLQISGTSGNGSAELYCTDQGEVVVEYTSTLGGTWTGSGLTPSPVGTPDVPAGARWLGTVTITSGAFANSVVDHRDWTITHRAVEGTGMSISCADSVCTYNVDTTVIQSKTDDYDITGALDASAATSTKPFEDRTSDPTCSSTDGRVWYRTDTDAYKACANDAVVTLSGSGSGYDPMDQTKVQLVEEFASGGTGSAYSGALGWFNGNQAGGGAVSAQAASGDKIGILRITSGTSTNDETQIQLGTLIGRWDNIANWEMKFIFRIPSSAASMRVAMGFLENNAGGATANRITIRYDAASDSVFKFETCTSSTCTTKSSTVSVTADTWYRGRIRSTSAGTILFSVDGETEVSHGSGENVPTSTALLPVFAVKTATGSAKILDMDWWAFQRTGLSR